MNTKILEYIIAIAQEHSISRAADRFFLTQPVLSRHLKKLEDRLGTPLFLRQKSGITLTEAGRIYINSAQNILHLQSELESDLRDMLEKEKNTLRVYVDYPCTKWLADHVLPGFQEKYSQVQVRFTYDDTEEILSFLASGEKGIGILIAPERRLSALEYVPLFTDALVIMKPVGKENTGKVFLQPTGTSLRAAEDRWLKQAGRAFGTILEAQTLRAGLEEARSGQGCACICQSMAEKNGLDLMEGIPPLPFQACVAYSKSMVFPPAYHALLLEILRSPENWFC